MPQLASAGQGICVRLNQKLYVAEKKQIAERVNAIRVAGGIVVIRQRIKIMTLHKDRTRNTSNTVLSNACAFEIL